MPDVILDPPRHIDSEPAKELKGLHRATGGERRHDRKGNEPSHFAFVPIIGYEIFRGVEVVDNLGDEKAAPRFLLRDQTDVFVLATKLSQLAWCSAATTTQSFIGRPAC